MVQPDLGRRFRQRVGSSSCANPPVPFTHSPNHPMKSVSLPAPLPFINVRRETSQGFQWVRLPGLVCLSDMNICAQMHVYIYAPSQITLLLFITTILIYPLLLVQYISFAFPHYSLACDPVGLQTLAGKRTWHMTAMGLMSPSQLFKGKFIYLLSTLSLLLGG